MKEYKFALEYCKDGNATQATIRAGYSEKGASVQAQKLLAKASVQAAIKEHKKDIAISAKINNTSVLRRWWEIANANAADLVKVEIECCRYCYGQGHKYQWTPAEFEKEFGVYGTSEYLDKPDQLPEHVKKALRGGIDFDCTKSPNPACPECRGKGKETIRLIDTSTLNSSTKRLYSGIQKTKDGFRITTRDQDRALENIAKYLGMFVEKKEISGPEGGAIPISIPVEELTKDQLRAIAAKALDNNDE